MRSGISAGLLALSLLFSPVGASAQPAVPNVKQLLTPEFVSGVKEWLGNPIINLSINSQNELRGSMTQADIDALDKQWREERESADKPLISATLSAPLSIYLLRIQAQSIGLYRELFVMDANGLNVGQSAITGDYWQGDEDKVLKTFPVGPDAIFVDAPEWNDELKIWQVQLNMTIADNGKAIGSATVEVNLTELQRRNAPASF